MMRIRRVLYRMGLRPKRGSIWYSPSLDIIYAFSDADYVNNFIKALNTNYQEDK